MLCFFSFATDGVFFSLTSPVFRVFLYCLCCLVQDIFEAADIMSKLQKESSDGGEKNVS